MAYQNDPGTNKEDQIKTYFVTREGAYKLMTLSEYSRPNRVPLNPGGGNNMGSAPVRVSFLTVTPGSSSERAESTESAPPPSNGFEEETRVEDGYQNGDLDDVGYNFCPDRICFNVGRELYVYPYRGVRNAADLTKPIDKRIYKGTFPTSHDFNAETATATSCSLIIGFSAGQIQLIDPFRKDCQISKLFNEDRLIDKTRVTCLKWVPGSPKQFLAAHSSGSLYLYNEDFPCAPGAPVYQTFKSGHGYTVFTCKTKSSRNPVYRWQVGEGALNEFVFSPDNRLLATVSQDGFLRVYNYHSMELVAHMRSYFGGILCVCWSPDGKYLVTGGEDDLVTVYSITEKRIICRGQGHRSWISQVAFDPYTTCVAEGGAGLPIDLGSDDDLRNSFGATPVFRAAGLGGAASSSFRSGQTSNSSVGSAGVGGVLRRGNKASVSSASLGVVSYRFGSVGHDTQLCLWDLTEDILRQPSGRQRSSTIFPQSPLVPASSNCFVLPPIGGAEPSSAASDPPPSANQKKHKRGFSLGAKLSGGDKHKEAKNQKDSDKDKDKENSGRPGKEETCAKLLGTMVCPRLEEVPLIEPLVCKKIAHERLTVLSFRDDCIVTACQEGFICTWARPGKAGLSHQQSINSPNPGGSPNLLPGGTIV